jgi:hypothetical protein
VTTAYRIANYDVPFWIDPNRSTGRYNRAPSGRATQYLCLHPLGCVAEYLRAQNLVSPDELSRRLVRIWIVEVDLSAAGSLTFDNADDHGLVAADLVADDHTACRDWADRVGADPAMPRIWTVPNAALAGTENVVIFGGRVMSPFHLPPIDDEVDLPATIVGDVSLLPSVVVPQTRFRGRAHAALDAWTRGEPFEYREPLTYPFPR